MKRCSKCKEVKFISEFCLDRKSSDNRQSQCKECMIVNNVKFRKKLNGLYGIWNAMKRRCLHSKDIYFKNYGGRGITVCKEWQNSFLAFYEWAKDRHKRGLTIDRRNNDGNYCPENCHFITQTENIRNSLATKLNTKKVKEIKKLLKEKKLSQREIGNIFNVTKANISSIKRGLTWVEIN